MKSNNRPGVMPAKHYTVGEKFSDKMGDNNYRKDCIHKRTTVEDLCSFCNKPIRIIRVALKLRFKNGWRLCCRDCQNKNDFKAKEDKIWFEEYFVKK